YSRMPLAQPSAAANASSCGVSRKPGRLTMSACLPDHLVVDRIQAALALPVAVAVEQCPPQRIGAPVGKAPGAIRRHGESAGQLLAEINLVAGAAGVAQVRHPGLVLDRREVGGRRR